MVCMQQSRANRGPGHGPAPNVPVADEVQRLLLPCKQPENPLAPDSIDIAAQKTLASLLKVGGRARRVSSTRGTDSSIRSALGSRRVGEAPTPLAHTCSYHACRLVLA